MANPQYPEFADLKETTTVYDNEEFWTQKRPTLLRPKPLPKRPPAVHRKKFGWMFLPTFLLAAALPIVWIALFYTTSAEPSVCRSGENTAPVFGINYSVGNLSFTMAKWIDVAFDVVMGHGGQALLCWVSYRAILDALVLTMESDSVTYELYITLTMNGSTVLTLLALLKRMWTSWEHRGRMAMIFLVTVYVLIFPTLMAAMTGYSTRAEGWYILNDGNLVPYQTFHDEVVDAQMILDGSRIGLKDNVTFTIADWREISGPNHTEYEEIGHQYKIGEATYRVGLQPLHTQFGYQFRGESYDMAFQSNPTRQRCIATERYHYGVSTVIFQGTMVVQILWTFTVYGLWVHSNRKGQLNGTGRKLGAFRAIADLAGAINKDLGEDISAYPDSVLEKELSKTKPGLKYYVSSCGDGTCHIGLSSTRPKSEVLHLEDGKLYR